MTPCEHYCNFLREGSRVKRDQMETLKSNVGNRKQKLDPPFLSQNQLGESWNIVYSIPILNYIQSDTKLTDAPRNLFIGWEISMQFSPTFL